MINHVFYVPTYYMRNVSLIIIHYENDINSIKINKEI